MFVLHTDKGEFASKSIVIAAGIGAFSPRRLPQACAEPWYGKGIYDVVTDPKEFAGQRVVIIGGGDSAFDWATQLGGVATHVSLVHRSDRFRAHGATVSQFDADVQAGRASMFTFHEIGDVLCKAGDDRFTHIVLRDVKAKTTTEIEADVVLPMLGFVSDIGPIADWGMTLEKDEIVVNQLDGDGAPRDLGGRRRDDVSGKAEADRLRVRRGGDRGEPGGALDLPGEESRAGTLVEHGDLRPEGRLTATCSSP